MAEALVNVNYRVSGRQAAYVYALAEKRAKDRVILKLVGLHGLPSSEEEADEFKSSAASVAASQTAAQGQEEQPQGAEPTAKTKSARGKAKGGARGRR